MAADPFGVGRIISHTKPFRPAIALWLLATQIGGAFNLALPQLTRRILDAPLGRGRFGIDDNLIIILLALALQGSCLVLTAYLSTRVGMNMISRLRQRLYDHMLSQPLHFYAGRRVGELIGRIADAGRIDVAVSAVLLSLQQVVILIGAMIAIALISVRLMLLVFASAPLLVVILLLLGRRLRRLSQEISDAYGKANGLLAETLRDVRTVQSFGREDHESRRYGERLARIVEMSIRRTVSNDTLGALIRVLIVSNGAFVLWVGRQQIQNHALSPGQLSALVMYTLLMAMTVLGMIERYKQLKDAQGILSRLFELLDQKPAIVDPEHPEELSGGRYAIEIDDVSFTYPGGEEPVLRQVSFHAKHGELVALVGPSGSGKSTLINLITRFYDVASGAIRINGVDVRSLRLSNLRRAIGIVPQETTLFSGTIRDNIAYGRLDAPEEAIVHAARLAHAHDFIVELPDGYDSLVGERGMSLSGGQRQRIAIARALLKDPPILLLDEPTSALDNEAEAIVQAALDRLTRGRTTLIVAHHLTTIERADQIIVLDGGEITGRGKHEELSQQDGLYRRLQQQSMRDHATGLWNGLYAQWELSRLVAVSERYHRPFSVLRLSVLIVGQRQTVGAGPGSQAVRKVADVLQSCVRAPDVLARFGPSEFAALLPETELEAAMITAERMLAAVEAIDWSPSSDMKATLRVGVSAYPVTGRTMEELLEGSRQALRVAEASGQRLVLGPTRAEAAPAGP